jgi:APA family basic amino acid/polyamine antiporter
MYSLGGSNWLRLIVWLLIGQVIYFGYGRRHSHLRKGANDQAVRISSPVA